VISNLKNKSSFGEIINKDSDTKLKKLVLLPPLKLSKINDFKLLSTTALAQHKDLSLEDKFSFGGMFKGIKGHKEADK
jgi:hypothetical protein